MADYTMNVHFIDKKLNKKIGSVWVHQVPGLGEECRFSGDTYYKVVQVVHCYDEDVPYHRANVGLERI